MSLPEPIFDRNDFLYEPSYKLNLSFGPLGKAIYLISESQLERFISQYEARENIAIMNIDGGMVGFDSDTIFIWDAQLLGLTSIPFLEEFREKSNV